eukprot:CAMPEP_0169104654 /NCGR_PEP_ID=MMETSP1015-20121227/23376_1 /TAXON_ID=342587 /ORGANISM="Karlodinium micrum, Strain CCMP2283" /LENGTH=160 /DNA_ID=CAMNT_0009165957 /DNA_START=41 /DNA_END=523 /DNA_ORIENTATION=+
MGNCCHAVGGEPVEDIIVDDVPVSTSVPNLHESAMEAKVLDDKEEPDQELKSEVQLGAQKPAAKEEDNFVSMVFDAGGIEQTVDVKFSPLGLKFHRRLPIVVRGFQKDSYGKTLGIGPNWTLKSMNGEDMMAKAQFDDALAALTKHMKSLPSYTPLKIET